MYSIDSDRGLGCRPTIRSSVTQNVALLLCRMIVTRSSMTMPVYSLQLFNRETFLPSACDNVSEGLTIFNDTFSDVLKNKSLLQLKINCW